MSVLCRSDVRTGVKVAEKGATALKIGLEDIAVRKYTSRLLGQFNLRDITLGPLCVNDPSRDRDLPAVER